MIVEAIAARAIEPDSDHGRRPGCQRRSESEMPVAEPVERPGRRAAWTGATYY